MHVKDYLQALSDENKIHVEKIGSGNWYWSFMSEEKHTRETILQNLRQEKEKIEATTQELEDKRREANEKRGDDDGRAELIEKSIVLNAELSELRAELGNYKDGDPIEVEKLKKETDGFEADAERWTDNVLILEAYMKNLTGGDIESLEQVKREVYGAEYVEGEGLQELEL